MVLRLGVGVLVAPVAVDLDLELNFSVVCELEGCFGMDPEFVASLLLAPNERLDILLALVGEPSSER